VERLFDRLERWLGPVLAALLAFITIGVFIQVVLRYVFAMSFLWGEELSLFAFIWCIFLGTAVCSSRHTHFSFDHCCPSMRTARLSSRLLAQPSRLFSLVASGQIRPHKLDGWLTIAAVLRQRHGSVA